MNCDQNNIFHHPLYPLLQQLSPAIVSTSEPSFNSISSPNISIPSQVTSKNTGTLTNSSILQAQLILLQVLFSLLIDPSIFSVYQLKQVK